MGITCLCVAFTLLILIFGYDRKAKLDGSSIGAIVLVGVIDLILVQTFNSLFLGLFDEAIVCTLQCVCIDMDLHGGKPKYGSKSFRENFDKYYEPIAWGGAA